MIVDYDLVVIGATGAGLATAQRAIALGQKVALVRQIPMPLQDRQCLALERVLLHLTGQDVAPSAMVAWIRQAIATDDFYEPLARLSESGVDVIPEAGTFRWHPHTSFQTEQRQLRSQYYAIATGTAWVEPPVAGFMTLPDLLDAQQWEKLGETIEIWGQSPTCLTLAYCLVKLGKRVTLVADKQLLPAEDPGMVQYLQSYLEAAGVTLRFRKVPPRLDSEEKSIIWAKARRGRTTGINLPPDFCWTPQMLLQVNSSLQTPIKTIYGCGSVLGGYPLPELAIAEATTIAQHISQRKTRHCPYHLTPCRLFEPLPFDVVGDSLGQLPPDTNIMQHHVLMDRIDQLRFPQELNLKLWLTPQAKVLRATVIGDRSGKLITYCRDQIRYQQPFSDWEALLEASGISAELCW